MSEAVARRYARALLAIGEEEKRLDALTREVRALGDAVASSPELQSLLSNPIVAPQSRHAVMADIAARLGLSPVVRNAALLLTDRRRGASLPAIADALEGLVDERSGKVKAEVTSAAPLSDAQAARIQASLERLTGRKISLARKVDPALIGGVVTRVGDRVFDGSVRTRLEQIRATALAS